MLSIKIVFWYWWALAAMLLVFEMMLPGVVFLFLAIGAAAAGFVLLVASDLSLEFQLVIFAVVSVVSAVGLRRTLRRLQHVDGPPTTLNSRGEALVGQVLVLDAPILNGRGRIILGDGSWTVTGADMVKGSKVRVISVQGTELKVEPAP
ncbi:MAG: NfeD family protein [Reyranella sp.]|nr:NfeD family protein [Reyranella sp.]MDP3158502.1 NfeD family protein [Reyranella sp.]